MKLLIIADDFTGALDTGAQLSKNHVQTTVFANTDTLPRPPADCEVLVLNANIRHAAKDTAYQCICKLLETYSDPDTYVYIKTDSVLRGNISATFAAALHTLKKPLCFIPAFPDLKRTTKNATAYVDGTLLEHSVFHEDPRTPTLDSYIPQIINTHYSVKYECIPLENQKTFLHADTASDTVYVFDCETNTQLTAIGQLIAQKNLYGFTAGCAGFASTFTDHLSFIKTPASVTQDNEPALFISGSANAVTLRQLAFAKELNYPIFSLSEAMFSNINNITFQMKDKGVYKDLIFRNTLNQARELLSLGQSVILATAMKKEELFNLGNLKKILKTEEAIHNYIAEYTSSLVKSILETFPIQNLVVFGGDMAAAILDKLSCQQVQVLGEISTGVPLCRFEWNGREMRLATKSGGFGGEDMIPVIERYFRG